MRRVLFVDDESNVLNGIRRMLRTHREEWEMQFVESGEEALARISECAFDVVVSDMRMPGMDGAELLSRVQQAHPETVRIVLSGHSEKDAVIRSVRCTHQYLSKPCDADKLIEAITGALDLRERLEDPKVTDLISRMEALPTIPALYQKVSEELKSEACSMQRVAKLVGQDPGMSMMLLKLVNSAYFGLGSPITTVERAVSFVGLDTLNSLILSVPLLDPKDCALREVAEQTWSRSLAAAVCGKAIARYEEMGPMVSENAFLGGMLHDVGKVMLAVNFPDDYRRFLEESNASDRPDFELEREIWGASHGEIAGYLLGLWGLSDSVVAAVTYHEEPIKDPSDALTVRGIVHAASSLAERRTGEPTELAEEMTALGLADKLEAWRTRAEEIVGAEGGAA